MNSYNNFWNWFQEEAHKLHTYIRLDIDIEDVWEKLYVRLDEVKKGLGYEVIIQDEDIIELTITARGDRNNIGPAERLVRAAPSIPGWKFVALKQAIDLDDINIELEGYDFNSDTLSFLMLEHENADKVQIGITHCLFDETNDEALIIGALMFLESYLGERNALLLIDDLVVVGKEYDCGGRKSIENLKSHLFASQKKRLIL